MEDNHYELPPQIQNHTVYRTYSRVSQCNFRLSVEINLDTVNRVVTARLSVQETLSNIGHPTGGPVCHMSKAQTSAVCILSSRPEVW